MGHFMHFIGKRQHFSYIIPKASSNRQLSDDLFKIAHGGTFGGRNSFKS